MKNKYQKRISEVLGLAVAVQIETDFCVFIYSYGHVHEIGIEIAKSKKEYDKRVAKFTFKTNCNKPQTGKYLTLTAAKLCKFLQNQIKKEEKCICENVFCYYYRYTDNFSPYGCDIKDQTITGVESCIERKRYIRKFSKKVKNEK